MTVTQLANRANAGLLPQTSIRKQKLFRPGSQSGQAGDPKASTRPVTSSGGAAGTQRWAGEWSGDRLTRAAPPGAGYCTDQAGVVCPKFAQAGAMQAMAELQLTEFNHRLTNVLQKLVIRIDRQRRTTDDPARAAEFESLIEGVHASARLHQHLLPRRTQMPVDLGTLLKNLALAIEGVTGLLCDVEVEPVDVPGHLAVHLAATVNELAWNALKHGYSGAEGGRIGIVCRRDPDGRLRLSVADQGCGLPAGFDPRVGDGLGLMIVCATARQFGGALRVESDGGARFTLLLGIPGV